MRLDTTVTEVNIHYPTDSSLLGDGTRVLTRIMKRVSELVGEQGTRLRDRLRTIRYRVMEIARLSRSKGQEPKEKMGEIPGVGALDSAGAEPGPAVLRGDRQRSEASGESEAASGTAGDEAGVGRDDSAGQPGAATNHGA